MPQAPGVPVDDLVGGGWNPLWRSFCRTMRAEGRSANTLATYGYALEGLRRHLSPAGRNPVAITRDQVRAYIEHTLAVGAPGTAHNRFRAIRRWFNWLVDEGEMMAVDHPMTGMRPPALPESVPEVLPVEGLARLLESCAGRDFTSRRDAALIRFLVDTGARRGEVAAMTMSPRDLDLNGQAARLVGKGRRERVVSFGAKAARDLDRYLRSRASQLHAGKLVPVALGRPGETAPALWLGKKGPMTGSGIYQVVRARAARAGLEQRVFAHLFRSTFADMWLDADGQEGDLMALAGWESLTMLRRYTAKRRAERARQAHKRLSPGDRI
jgi:site-specific recombinase XerD